MKGDQGRGQAGSFLQVGMKQRWWNEVQIVSQVTEDGGRSQKYRADLWMPWLKWQPQPLETTQQEPMPWIRKPIWATGRVLPKGSHQATQRGILGKGPLGSSLCPPPPGGMITTPIFLRKVLLYASRVVPSPNPAQCTSLDVSCIVTPSMVT